MSWKRETVHKIAFEFICLHFKHHNVFRRGMASVVSLDSLESSASPLVTCLPCWPVCFCISAVVDRDFGGCGFPRWNVSIRNSFCHEFLDEGELVQTVRKCRCTSRSPSQGALDSLGSKALSCILCLSFLIGVCIWTHLYFQVKGYF